MLQYTIHENKCHVIIYILVITIINTMWSIMYVYKYNKCHVDAHILVTNIVNINLQRIYNKIILLLTTPIT
jgi:hypothetical protein